jgi:hypothetical protein
VYRQVGQLRSQTAHLIVKKPDRSAELIENVRLKGGERKIGRLTG